MNGTAMQSNVGCPQQESAAPDSPTTRRANILVRRATATLALGCSVLGATATGAGAITAPKGPQSPSRLVAAAGTRPLASASVLRVSASRGQEILTLSSSASVKAGQILVAAREGQRQMV